MASLLAVDLGLRAGLACFGNDGKLIWYRSRNFGSSGRLRKGAFTIVNEISDLEWIIIEGGETLAKPWLHQAKRRGANIQQISAETWRADILSNRQQRTGAEAKRSAHLLARQVISWSGHTKPTSLRHDAAEAILIGVWGVLKIGWLDQLPF